MRMARRRVRRNVRACQAGNELDGPHDHQFDARSSSFMAGPRKPRVDDCEDRILTPAKDR